MGRKHKRSNGEGTLRLRSNGTWECTIMTGRDHLTGKRITKSFYARTQQACKAKRDAFLRDHNDGIKDNQVTFREFAEFWYDRHTADKAPATKESYRYTLNILCNADFADMRLQDITLFNVEVALDKIHEVYSNSTYSKCRATIYMVLELAVGMDLIRKNVVHYAKRFKTKKSQPKEAFTPSELSLLLEKLPVTKMGLTIRCMLISGLRRQEVAALDASKGHIDPNGGFLIVEQAVGNDKGRAFIKEPKNESSVRRVPIAAQYRHYIEQLYYCCGDGLLWESPKHPGSGIPINLSTFNKYFKETLAMVEGVRLLGTHSCRHTFITQLREANVDMATISALTGHMEERSTRGYVHIREEEKLVAVERLAEHLQ